MTPTAAKHNSPDRFFLFALFALTVLGVVMVYSSTAVMPVAKSGGSMVNEGRGYQFMYLKKHLVTLLIALMGMFSFYRMSLKKLNRLSYLFLAAAFVLLVAVFIPGLGVKINGAKRWLRLWPSTFQPSEFVKFAMILYLASYLSDRKYDLRRFKDFMKPIGVMLLFQAVMLMQPDFGGAFTLGVITITLIYLAGAPIKYLLALAGATAPVLVYLLTTPYRLKRIFAFLDPWQDPYGDGFQLVQSFVALGSGGLKGVGLGEGMQKLNFLPEVNTDFIFSLIGEELGLLGALFTISMFLLLFIRGMKIAERTKGRFSYYLCTGLVLMIVYQMIINVAVVTGLLPTKGLPLPFISYGGSSLLINFISAGVILRISRSEDEPLEMLTKEQIIKRRVRLRRKQFNLRRTLR
ncbi:MAG: putative lipid II flippase FtsW [Nitrospirae bacterium]|nr:putative lipid II flippase FtsW [Nitrospirota bacterium]